MVDAADVKFPEVTGENIQGDVAIVGYEEKIAPELSQWVQPIESVQPHPDNMRKHRIEKIAQALESHGQRSLIIIHASTRNILKGNGTWESARLLGWKNLAMMDMAMSDADALDYLLADNRASDLSSYQRKKLYGVLSQLESLGNTLWDADELADLEEEFSTITELPDTGMAGDEQSREEEASEAPTPRTGAKMREVPLVLTQEDHAAFTEHLKTLQKSYGTQGSIATILESAKRQADAEVGSPVQTGPVLTPEMEASVTRDVIGDLMLVVNAMESLSKEAMVEILNNMLPEAPQGILAEGQVGMDEGDDA